MAALSQLPAQAVGARASAQRAPARCSAQFAVRSLRAPTAALRLASLSPAGAGRASRPARRQRCGGVTRAAAEGATTSVITVRPQEALAPLLPCAPWRPSEPAVRWPRHTAAVGVRDADAQPAAFRGWVKRRKPLTDTPRLQIDSAAAYDSHLASTPADKLLVVECSATWCAPPAPAGPGATRLLA